MLGQEFVSSMSVYNYGDELTSKDWISDPKPLLVLEKQENKSFTKVELWQAMIEEKKKTTELSWSHLKTFSKVSLNLTSK